MAAKRHERTHARANALQVLYTSEIQGEPASVVMATERGLYEDGPLAEYAIDLIEGVEAHQVAIDERLASTSENWSLARMPIVDRCILRLATYEMLHVDDVPVSVSINEAVELAKDFGGKDESPQFVNGVLGRIARQMEEGAPRGAATDGSAAAGEPGAGEGAEADEAAAGKAEEADEKALA